MEPEILVFMPNGDVTLTLVRNIYEEEEQLPTYRTKRTLSTVQQTSINENKELELDDLDEVLEDESLLFYAPEPPNAGEGPSYPPTPRGVRGSDASSRRDRSSSPPASFWASLKRQQAARNNEVIEEEEEPAPEQKPVKKEKTIVSTHEVQCVVSSRHMMLASKVFENLLTGTSTEAKTLRTKGHVTIPVLADLDTLIIILTIIHGPSRKVPRSVTLQELSNLATLVSHFGMIETVQFFSDTWIDSLQREGFPKTYSQDVLQLLFVFWVFDRPEEFKSMTRLAQRECDENLIEDVKGLPIPHNIIDAIKREREYAIETAITIIHTLITRYMDGQTICDASLDEDLQYACDAMVLGSLMKSSRKIGLWPRPEAPFQGQKFKDVARLIRSIKILDVCNRSSRRFATLGTSSNCHGLEDELEASMKGIEAGLDGLELLAYAKKSDDLVPQFEMFVLAPEEEEEVVLPVKENGVPDYHKEEDHVLDYQKGDKAMASVDVDEENEMPILVEEEVMEVKETQEHNLQATVEEEDVIPPMKENGAHDFHTYTTEQAAVFESPREESKPSYREYAAPEPRMQTPKDDEFENHIQEGVKLVPTQPSQQVSQEFQQAYQQTDSRGSSRASDYQVQEPTIAIVKEEQKPVVSRNSPSQEWMNHGRVVTKPTADPYSVRERENVRSPVMRENEDSKPLAERKVNRNANGNGTGNGYGNGNGYGHSNGNGHSNGYSNGNGAKSGHVTPKVASVEEIVEHVPRAQQTSRVSYPERPSSERLTERRPEKISSNERISTAPPKAPQPENTPAEKRSEKTYSTERVTYPSRNSQTERSSQAEKLPQSERTTYPETASYSAKKTPPPEVPVHHQPQRTSYSGQPTQNGRSTQSPQPTSQVEKTAQPEKNSYNGKVSQPEQFHQQRAVQNEQSAPQAEKPNISSHSSYNKSSHLEVSQQQQQQQKKIVQIEKPNSQPEKVSQLSQSTQHNGKPKQQETPQSQQKATQATPPPQPKTTSPPPQKQTTEPASKEVTTVENAPGSEIDENWGQPQKFMRKSKKKFSTRF